MAPRQRWVRDNKKSAGGERAENVGLEESLENHPNGPIIFSAKLQQ